MNAIEVYMFECIEKLQEIEDINCGGCGIAALSIYRALKKQYPDAPDTFILIGTQDEDETPAHVVYVWENIVADTASTTWNDDEEFLARTPYTYWGPSIRTREADLLRLLRNVRAWNRTFDRLREVPKIEKLLGVSLSDIPR